MVSRSHAASASPAMTTAAYRVRITGAPGASALERAHRRRAVLEFPFPPPILSGIILTAVQRLGDPGHMSATGKWRRREAHTDTLHFCRGSRPAGAVRRDARDSALGNFPSRDSRGPMAGIASHGLLCRSRAQ